MTAPSSATCRIELLGVLLSLADNPAASNFEIALECIRDYLTERDGSRDPELHRAFQRAFEAISERCSKPAPGFSSISAG